MGSKHAGNVRRNRVITNGAKQEHQNWCGDVAAQVRAAKREEAQGIRGKEIMQAVLEVVGVICGVCVRPS